MTSTTAVVTLSAILGVCLANDFGAAPGRIGNATVRFNEEKYYDANGNLFKPKFTEAVYDKQGRKITPFMRKHGLTHDKGWGLRAGELLGMEPDVGIDHCGKLAGFYVMPCTQVFSVGGQEVSMVQTRHYHEGDQTYEIDTTYYIGDPDCTPAKSDVYYKTWMHGVLDIYGDNTVVKGATRASLNWTDGQYFFGDNPRGQALVNNLNQYCACGGKWSSDTMREVKEADCEHPVNPKAMRPCNIISGEVDYFNYQHHPDCNHYITSRDCFQDANSCWQNPISPGWVREKIPESGNNHASDCDYKLWAKCGPGVKAAHDNCDGCVGLECDGCLFREMNPNWSPTTHDVNDWYECCPCIYYYAEKYEKNWMTTLC